MKILEKVLDENSDVDFAFFWQIIGPLFLVCTFALSPNHLWIFSAGVAGLFLCSRWQMTGFFYSLIALALASVVEHLFFSPNHFWLLGLEGSYAVSFLITALSAERHCHFIQSLSSQIQTRNSSISHLEEEFAKSCDAATAQQMIHQEKIAALQSQVEEAQAEQSSLQILNEVLRKTTAHESEEMERLRSELYEVQNRLCFLLAEKEDLQKEIARFSNTDAVVLENKKLIEEINAARLDKEQTHMINETLAHLHLKENGRAKSFEEKAILLEEQKEALTQQVLSLRKEREEIRSQSEQAFADRALSQVLDEKLKAAQTECDAMKERLRLAEEELRNREQAAPPEPIVVQAPVDMSCYVEKEAALALEEKVKALSQVEILHKQLKAQFAEKNEILHQTRSELFHTNTALEALRIDLSSTELQQNPIPQEMIAEFMELDEKVSYLQKENEELQNLISSLLVTHPTEAQKRKKKVKVIPEQEYLF